MSKNPPDVTIVEHKKKTDECPVSSQHKYNRTPRDMEKTSDILRQIANEMDWHEGWTDNLLFNWATKLNKITMNLVYHRGQLKGTKICIGVADKVRQDSAEIV